MEETEGLLQLANSRCNVLAKQLGDETKNLNAVAELYGKTIREKVVLMEKLEAIEKEMRFFESLEVNLEEFKAKDIVKQFRKVLGVRKEMQEKDESC